MIKGNELRGGEGEEGGGGTEIIVRGWGWEEGIRVHNDPSINPAITTKHTGGIIYTIEYENIAVAVIKTIIARHEKYIISKKLENFGGHRSSEDDHSY